MKSTKIRTSKGTTKITASTIFTSSLQERKTDAEVVFGVSGRNCQGSGICRVLPWKGNLTDTRSCMAFHAVIQAPEAGAVGMEIFSSGRCGKLVDLWQSEKCFYMEEEYLLPQFITQCWETGPVTILRGLHPAAGFSGGVRIMLKYRLNRGILLDNSGAILPEFLIN